jgi:hypothetical protein
MPPPLSASILRRSITGVAALSATVAVAMAAQAVATSPYVYGYGPQGLGYYLVPTAPVAVAAPAAPAAVAAPAAPRLTVPSQPSQARSGGAVGPGARNWATGNRVPSHRPWLRSRS